MTMAEAKREIREPSRSSQQDLLLVQYELHLAARDHMRIAGRIVYAVFIAGSAFLGFNGFQGSGMPTRLIILLYAVVLFGAFWWIEDSRRSSMLRNIEEVLYRYSSINRDDDIYIRHRYQSSNLILSRFLASEPMIWLVLAVCAIAFQFYFTRHLA